MNTKTKKDTIHFLGKKSLASSVRVADTVIHLERGVNAKEFKRFAIKNPQLFANVEVRMIAKPIVVHVEDTNVDIEGYELIPYKRANLDLLKKRRAKLAVKLALRNTRENRSGITILGPQLQGKSNVIGQILQKLAERRAGLSTLNIESKDVKLQSIERNDGIVIWPIDIKNK